MDKKRKEYIDLLWENTLYGQCVFAGLNNQTNEHEKIAEKITKEYPFSVEEAGKILASNVNQKINRGEFIKYLKYMETEEPDLLQYLYLNTTFYDEMLKIN